VANRLIEPLSEWALIDWKQACPARKFAMK
jgi:hypothetical protein